MKNVAQSYYGNTARTSYVMKNKDMIIAVCGCMSQQNGYAEILNYVDANSNYQTLGDEFEIETELYEIMFFEVLNDTNTNDSSQLIKLECENKACSL